MSLIYDTSKLYFVKLGMVTKIEHEGLYTKGATYYNISPKTYIAKLIKTDYKQKIFKLISSNIEPISNNSQTTQNRGDIFVCNATPFNIKSKNTKRYLSKKILINFENDINTKNKQAKSNKNKEIINLEQLLK